VTIWILATMALLHITLNVMTVMVTALTIGLGIDYAIHVIERYREERSHHDKLESITETIEHTGSALVISALTTIAGFGVLVISPMPLVRDFGIITAATILYALLVAIIILPILLLAVGRLKGTSFGGTMAKITLKKTSDRPVSANVDRDRATGQETGKKPRPPGPIHSNPDKERTEIKAETTWK